MIDLELLIKNGVQFGHQAWRVCPKMKPYIWGEKNGIHLIDVSKTAQQIEKATQFLEEVAARGEPILWVGTKKAAQPVIEQAAQKLSAPYVANRWIGGTLTNFSEVKKAILKLKHYESLLEHSEKQYTKKEYGRFRKIVERVEENVGGIRNISWPIGALVVVDAKKEQVAVKEAQRMGIPVVALTDTNTDPSGIDFVIPGNDDIARSVRTVLDPLVEAVSRGLEKAEQVAAQQQQKAEQEQQAQASTQESAEQQDEVAEQEDSASKEASVASEDKQEAAQTEKKATQAKQTASAAKKQTEKKAASETQATTKQASQTTKKSSQTQSKAKASTGTTGSSSTSKKSTSTASTSKKTTTSSSAKSASATTKKADATKTTTTKKSQKSAAEGDNASSEKDSSDQSAE